MELKKLTETLSTFLNEAEMSRDNIFETELDINLNSMAGGISLKINKENGNVSLSTTFWQGPRQAAR